MFPFEKNTTPHLALCAAAFSRPVASLCCLRLSLGDFYFQACVWDNIEEKKKRHMDLSLNICAKKYDHQHVSLELMALHLKWENAPLNADIFVPPRPFLFKTSAAQLTRFNAHVHT